MSRWGALPLGELTPDDELELRHLVSIAWGVRHKPDALRIACGNIADWHDRRYQRAYERRQRSTAAVLKVLRETAPK